MQPLSPDDARAIDIKYHLKCYVKHVQRSGPSATTTASDDKCARALCADKEFLAILTTMLSKGQILSMTRVCSIYEQVMQSSGLYRTLSMKEAKAKVSHARTVVRECCKGDDESQWEMGKFDPPPPKNPLTDGHQNLRT